MEGRLRRESLEGLGLKLWQFIKEPFGPSAIAVLEQYPELLLGYTDVLLVAQERALAEIHGPQPAEHLAHCRALLVGARKYGARSAHLVLPSGPDRADIDSYVLDVRNNVPSWRLEELPLHLPELMYSDLNYLLHDLSASPIDSLGDLVERYPELRTKTAADRLASLASHCRATMPEVAAVMDYRVALLRALSRTAGTGPVEVVQVPSFVTSDELESSFFQALLPTCQAALRHPGAPGPPCRA